MHTIRFALVVLLAACAGTPAPTAVAPSTVAELPTHQPPAMVPPPRPRVVDEVPDRTAPDADFRRERPQAAPERPFAVPPAKPFQLPGGLPVLLVESHDLPLVSLSLVVKHGSGANPANQAGLAELTAALLDEGTATRSSTQISDEVEQIGASLSAYASWDASVVNVFAMTDVIDRALAVWADVLLHPAFPADEVERVRANVLAGISRRKDSPPAVAGVTLARALYPDAHPYAWPGNGTGDSVGTLKPEDLRRFWETHYRPNASVLVVAGALSEADVRSKIGPLLVGWKPRPAPAARLPRPASPTSTTIYLVDKPGAPQSSIRVGTLGVARNTPDYHELLVMNEILGGGFRRLDLELREKRGWTYGARSSFDMRRAVGPFSAGGEFVADKTADSVSVLLNQITRMRDEDVSEDELAEAKQSIIRAFPARFETTSQIAGQLAALAIYDLPADHLRNFTKRIAAIKRADVRRVARKALDPKRLAIVVVGDQKSHEAELRKIATVQVRDLEGRPVTPAPGAAVAP